MMKYTYYIFFIFLFITNINCFKNDVEPTIKNEEYLLEIENIEFIIELESFELEQHPYNDNLVRAIINIDCFCDNYSTEDLHTLFQNNNRMFFNSNFNELNSINILLGERQFTTDYSQKGQLHCYTSIFINIEGISEEIGEFCVQF